MPPLEAISVKDLFELTAEDLRGGSYFKIKDPWNLTTEQLEKFRNLVGGIDKSRPVDAVALGDRLRHVAPSPTGSTVSRSRSRSTSTSTPVPEDHEEDYLREEKEAHDALIRDGGRPSHPMDSGFDILDKPGRYAEIISYWRGSSSRGWDIIKEQLLYWKDFREYQVRARQECADPEMFDKYVQQVHKYRIEKSLQGDAELHHDHTRQTQLDDWREYQYYQYRKADRFRKDMKYAETRMERSQEKQQAAIDAGQATESINSIEKADITYWRAKRGTARRKLEKHSILLKWIGEQIPIIASGHQSPGRGPEAPARDDDAEGKADLRNRPGIPEPITPVSPYSNPAQTLGKRKRSVGDPPPSSANPSKVQKSCTTTNVGESKERGIIADVLTQSTTPAKEHDECSATTSERQGGCVRLRRSRRLAQLKREAQSSESTPTALPFVRPPRVQKVSIRKRRLCKVATR
ncbi:hypothetical protein H2203_005205 [Taxawa tesnikishii (nom. ined.)]|nr:hypothetical protein H2203_005205 [Dothideales sp. JES 119]